MKIREILETWLQVEHEIKIEEVKTIAITIEKGFDGELLVLNTIEWENKNGERFRLESLSEDIDETNPKRVYRE